MMARLQSNEADVLIISEGAYPYISGGVSAWMQTLMSESPHLRFAVVFLGSRPEDYKKMHYELPPNVVDFKIQYLFSALAPQKALIKERPISWSNLKKLQKLHEWFKNPNNQHYGEVLPQIIELFDPINGITQEQFLHGHSSWEFTCHHYEKYSSDPSFIDYFWTVKNIHTPLWEVANLVYQLPKVKIVHTVATGYAGFLGALIKSHQKIPLILTEHGIYTKERRIEILDSKMVKHENPLTRNELIGYLRQLWIDFFESLSKICYEMSDDITALFQLASQSQREYGADPRKQSIIPNGIDIAKLKAFRHHKSHTTARICFLGRIVPIKDIKTFIRAIKALTSNITNLDVWIVGPLDEDPEYAAECQRLVESFNLESLIHFKGKMTLADVLPQVDLIVLSSISEGMPLVVLEAFAAGIPVVATNVGSCEELIDGVGEADMALGKAGKIVKIASPKALAEAILSMLDNTTWSKASVAATQRVERYYDLSMMMNAYHKLYAKYL